MSSTISSAWNWVKTTATSAAETAKEHLPYVLVATGSIAAFTAFAVARVAAITSSAASTSSPLPMRADIALSFIALACNAAGAYTLVRKHQNTRENISLLQAENATLKHHITLHQDSINQISQKIFNLKMGVKLFQEANTMLQNNLDMAQINNEQQQQTLTQQNKTIESQENDIASLRTKVLTLTDQNKSLQNENESQKLEISKQEATINSQRAEIKHVSQERDSLKQQIPQQSKKITELEKHLLILTDPTIQKAASRIEALKKLETSFTKSDEAFKDSQELWKKKRLESEERFGPSRTQEQVATYTMDREKEAEATNLQLATLYDTIQSAGNAT